VENFGVSFAFANFDLLATINLWYWFLSVGELLD